MLAEGAIFPSAQLYKVLYLEESKWPKKAAVIVPRQY